MALLGLDIAPGLRKHLLFVRVRQGMKSLLVWHPLHRIMLRPHFRISLISLKEEEMDSLVVSLRTEPELVLDRAKLPMQLHPAHTSLLTHLPHSRRDLVLPLLDQTLRQTPHTSLIARQQQKDRIILAVQREIRPFSNSQSHAMTEAVHEPMSPGFSVPLDQLPRCRVSFPLKDLAGVCHHVLAGNLLLHHVEG